MWRKHGKRALVVLLVSGITLGLSELAFDSQAEAGFLKNGVRPGDRSNMALRRPPPPGAAKRIRIAPLPEIRRPAAPGPGTRASRQHPWFWAMVDVDITSGSPSRWTTLIEIMRQRRLTQGVLVPDSRLKAIAGDWQAEITAAAAAHNISEAVLVAVAAVESAGRSRAVSPKGAQGLMQLMPGTAKRFGVTDSFDAGQNLAGGAAYLDFLLKRFDGDIALALAGYNAGENAVIRNGGIPPYAETRDYVVRVLDGLAGMQTLCAEAPMSPRQRCLMPGLPPAPVAAVQ